MNTQQAPQLSMTSFHQYFPITPDNIYHEIYYHFRDCINVKHEDIAVRNLEIIFTTTFKLANRVGFHAMSLRDLCRETGISMGGLYNYITSKDALASMIVEFASGKLSDTIHEITEDTCASESKIDRFIRLYIYTAETFQPWLFFLFMEAKNLSQKNKTKVLAFEQKSAHWIKDAIDNDRNYVLESDSNAVFISHMVISMLENWFLKRWHYTAHCTNADDYADYCIRLVRKITATAYCAV